MATRSANYNVGNVPPFLKWTLVRGDTASFKVFLVDDEFQPVDIPAWSIEMAIKRPNNPDYAGILTDDATEIVVLYPQQDDDDEDGEFTVSISADESALLAAGDIFDIELSLPQRTKVWTVAQGYVDLIKDVTG